MDEHTDESIPTQNPAPNSDPAHQSAPHEPAPRELEKEFKDVVSPKPAETEAAPAPQQTEPQANAVPKQEAKRRIQWKAKFNDGKLKFLAFCRECWRVLRVTKKPDRQEFITIVKISGLGILAVGALGFLITLVREGIVRFA